MSLSSSSSPSLSFIVTEIQQFFSLPISVQGMLFPLHTRRLLSQDFMQPLNKSSNMLSGASEMVIQSIAN